MSPSSSLLQVDSDDPAATITVLDGSQNIVVKRSGSLRERLDNGFYKVRVRVGSAFEERLVALDDRLPVQRFGRPKISSPVPVEGTAQSHEYHQLAVGDAFNHPGANLGSGSRLLILAREWSPDFPRSHLDPAGALSLVMPSGERRPLASFAHIYKPGDAFAIGCVAVDPGRYGVELTFPDGARHCRPLQAVKDWTTQIFMLFHDIEGERLPNLAGGSVVVAKKAVTEDDETRVAEIALEALTQHRPLLPGFLQDVLHGKFDQPLLGVIGAHLLLRDGKAGGLFSAVFGNVSRMLGADDPDVIALATKLAPPKPRSVTEPPMLRASWDLLIEASGTVPELFERGSPAAKVAERALPAGAWLLWESEAGNDEPSGSDAKLEIVRNFVQAQAETRVRTFTTDSQFSLAPEGRASVTLSDRARSDLCKALGVPQTTLDGLLARL